MFFGFSCLFIFFVSTPQVQKSEYIRHDKALDIDLEHAKIDLAKLQETESGEQFETTRARLEREFKEYVADMHLQIADATAEAETIGDTIDQQQVQHTTAMLILENQHRTYVEEKKNILLDYSEQIKIAQTRNQIYIEEHLNEIRQAEQSKLNAEYDAEKISNSGTALRRALTIEGGMDLYEAKQFNAKQYQDDAQKLANITAHLTMEVEQLSSSLAQATAERDMLMEESKMYGR